MKRHILNFSIRARAYSRSFIRPHGIRHTVLILPVQMYRYATTLQLGSPKLHTVYHENEKKIEMYKLLLSGLSPCLGVTWHVLAEVLVGVLHVGGENTFIECYVLTIFAMLFLDYFFLENTLLHVWLWGQWAPAVSYIRSHIHVTNYEVMTIQ